MEAEWARSRLDMDMDMEAKVNTTRQDMQWHGLVNTLSFKNFSPAWLIYIFFLSPSFSNTTEHVSINLLHPITFQDKVYLKNIKITYKYLSICMYVYIVRKMYYRQFCKVQIYLKSCTINQRNVPEQCEKLLK
jgi:predicted CDP-diglyceride synthetase/phosphatidate cytidylyltransferase